MCLKHLFKITTFQTGIGHIRMMRYIERLSVHVDVNKIYTLLTELDRLYMLLSSMKPILLIITSSNHGETCTCI